MWNSLPVFVSNGPIPCPEDQQLHLIYGRRSRTADILIHFIFFGAGPLNKFIQLVMNGL
ncbi:MAG: hypothetical protein JWR61_4716 [Ferruginibacter sp.]|jgi:hypothetical protein|nr:hypothetical protein [Ferruginibacter sp.]